VLWLHQVGPATSSAICRIKYTARRVATRRSRAQRGLTPRSSGAPTAGHQARSGGTRYIFASPGLASCRRRPLSSNVRPQKLRVPFSRGVEIQAQRTGEVERVSIHGQIQTQSSLRPARAAKQSADFQLMMEMRARKNSAFKKCKSARAHQQRARGISGGARNYFNSHTLVKLSWHVRAAASTPQQVLVCGSTGRRRPVLLASSRLAGKNQFMPCTFASHFNQIVALGSHAVSRLRPNPSLKLSTNGVSRWSSGAGPAAHFAPTAQRATPLAPA
jgi:hypothetical protein